MAAVAATPGTRLHVERVEPDEDLCERWDELALASDNVYLSREWIEPWLRHVGRHGEFFLYAAWQGDEPFALVPLIREHRGGVSLLRFAGYEPSDHPGVVCAADDLGRGLEALCHVLRRPELAWDVFLADRRPPGERYAIPARAVLRERYPYTWVEFGEDGWEGYLATRSRKLAYRLRHDQRRLDALGARYECDLGDPEAAIRELLDLHARQWGDGSRFTTGALRRFQEEALARAADRGWLRIRRIVLDGKAIVSRCGFRVGSCEHGYMSGRLSGFPGIGLGYMGWALELREAAREGASVFRCGFGASDQKRQFANRRSIVETVAYTGTLRGRMAVTAEMWQHRNLPGRRAAAADPADLFA